MTNATTVTSALALLRSEALQPAMNMNHPKNARDMTAREYQAARRAVIRQAPPAPQKPAGGSDNDVRGLPPAEYRQARQRAISGR